MRTMTCTTITALHDQKKRLVFVSSLNVLADCIIAMDDLGRPAGGIRPHVAEQFADLKELRGLALLP
jgi:hypothetical protein